MSATASIIERPNTASFSSILLSNMVPFFGVMFWGWTFYSVILVYWFETLWHTAFMVLRLLTAQVNGGHQYFYLYKIKQSLKLILARTGILLFYLLFIVVFIGFQASTQEDVLNTFANMFHGKKYMIWALLGFTAAGIVEYIFQYRLSGQYQMVSPESQFKIIDARFVVIHLIIVLGFFVSEMLTKDLKWTDNANHVLVSVFVLIKLAVDVVGHLIHNGALKKKVQPFLKLQQYQDSHRS